MISQIQIICQLLLAAFLGSLIGVEREMKKKKAGLQTYSLVTLGSCLFAIIALSLGESIYGFDPSSIIMAIALGMGFIGAGAIIRGEFHSEGLTTAAGLWTAAAIGLAVGANFYSLAIAATFLVIVILVGFGLIEGKILKK